MREHHLNHLNDILRQQQAERLQRMGFKDAADFLYEWSGGVVFDVPGNGMFKS